MNQISALPNPLEILFQEYNQGRIESVGFRSFTLHAGESNSYRTLKSALIVPVSGRAIFSFEHEPFIAKRGLFLHGCPDKTLTISALGEQDFHYINMYYENDRPLLFSHKLKNPEQTFSILVQSPRLGRRHAPAQRAGVVDRLEAALRRRVAVRAIAPEVRRRCREPRILRPGHFAHERRGMRRSPSYRGVRRRIADVCKALMIEYKYQ